MFTSTAWAKRALKPRAPGSHKGENGRVLVVGGSRKYCGAPALAGLAALRSGADLSYILAPSAVSDVIAGFSPDLIVWPYEGECLNSNGVRAFENAAGNADALVIGNGLSKEKGVSQAAQEIISSWKKPCVIDGDVLGAVRGNAGTVYTPHKGEFKRMGFAVSSSLEATGRAVRNAVRELGGVVLLKGAVDVISDGERVAFNKAGNAAMTVGGTGDVLAGICGCFLSQGCSCFDSACLAAFVNGSAGDLAFKEFGFSLLASDLLDFLPRVLKPLRKK